MDSHSSRVPKFKSAMTHQMLLNGDIFEYWTHAAAFLPITDFRFSLPYKHAIKSGQTHWYRNRDTKLMGELLARIRSDGPIRSRDIEDLSGEEWEELKEQYDSLDLETYLGEGIKGLERIPDRRMQRLIAALLTFLNPC